MKPSEIDLSSGLLGTFGWTEYEQLATEIIKHLAQVGNTWGTPFRAEDIAMAGKQPTIFAMFCASGWVSSTWYPSGLKVSEKFIARLEEKRR